MKKILFTCTLLLMVLGAVAVPVKPGLWKTLKLSDGTEIRAQLKGDEFGHYWLGEDGRAYMMTQGTTTYRQVDAQTVLSRAKALRAQTNAQRVQRLPRRVGSVGNYTGTKRCLVLLVNYQDVQFQEAHDNALYQRIANEEGFSEGEFVGSIADYFKAQSRGKFEIDFEVVGPLTVSNNASYYGSNDEQGSDIHAGEMVCEAVEQAKDLVTDWSQYDWDGDGYVEQVYVIYAGRGEADSGVEDTIWPHQYDLFSANYYGDGTGPVTAAEGLQVNTYACGPELMGNGSLEGIGTMCHEFSHCLGYPDFYDTDYSGGQGMGSWDLMDAGSYNGNSFIPAGYTSYERWAAGWLEPIELNEADVTVENMLSLQSGGNCYVIYNKAHPDEFYLLENRQLDGWDAAIPSAGLLIIHCDYDAEVWYLNQPNDDPEHQRMTVVPADGRYQTAEYMGYSYFTDEGIKTDPFPQGDIKAFNRDFKTYDNIAQKAAQLFNMNVDGTPYIDSSVEEITQNPDGSISFKFVAKPEPTAIQSVRTEPSTLDAQRIYTLDGRHMGTDINALGRGIYIINGKKVRR